jgi:hypothetical protein
MFQALLPVLPFLQGSERTGHQSKELTKVLTKITRETTKRVLA